MYREKYEYWKNHQDLDATLREELNNLSDKEIEDCFYTDVKFQTAGMRGLMGVGTNRINIHTIRKATIIILLLFLYFLFTDIKSISSPYLNRLYSQFLIS